MPSKLTFLAFTLAVALAFPSAATVAAGNETVLRIGTLVPAGTSWDRILKAWNRSLSDATGGSLKMQLYMGASAGDERDMLRKMKVGQLDGGIFSSVGLSQVTRAIQVLQVPGMIYSYEQLHKVRKELSAEFEGMFEKEGFKLIAWGDAGFVRIFSNQPILVPSDFKKVRPWAPAGDLAVPEALKEVGANPISLGIPEVVAALQTGMVDTVYASAVAAVGFQWFRNVKYVSKEATAPIVGATLIRNETLRSLTPEQQAALQQTAKKAEDALLKSIEGEDKKAYKTLIDVAHLKEFSSLATPEQEKAWVEVGLKVRDKLTGKLWTKELLDRVVATAAKYGDGRAYGVLTN